MGLQLKVMGRDKGIHSAGHMTPVAPPSPPTDSPIPPLIQIDNEREVMYRMIVAMLKEVNRLAGDEELAKHAQARMTAMLVASNLTRTGETILRGYEKGYLQPLVDEMMELTDQLKKQLREDRKPV